MPDEIRNDLIDYLEERALKVREVNGADAQSYMLPSERNYLGKELKPKVDNEDMLENEMIDQIKQV